MQGPIGQGGKGKRYRGNAHSRIDRVNDAKKLCVRVGGTLLAGVGKGVSSSEIEAAKNCVTIKKKFQPNWDNHARYGNYFEVYRDILKSLEASYSKLYEYVAY